MAWIKTVSPEEAEGRLQNLYERLAGANRQVDHIMQIHSLRPHTLEGHMALYKNVLHHSANTLPKWFLEAVGVYVSYLNGCDYCVRHHFAGMCRQIDGEERAEAIRSALVADEPERFFARAELALMRYARVLALEPARISRSTLDDLRAAGAMDGEILEVNQVVSYFCYANRTVLGLGVSIKGESLGLSPNNSGDPGDWRHR